MSLDITKTDPILGQRIFEYLSQRGVETPRTLNALSPAEQIAKLEEAFTTIMQTLGLNLGDDSLSAAGVSIGSIRLSSGGA